MREKERWGRRENRALPCALRAAMAAGCGRRRPAAAAGDGGGAARPAGGALGPRTERGKWDCEREIEREKGKERERREVRERERVL